MSADLDSAADPQSMVVARANVSRRLAAMFVKNFEQYGETVQARVDELLEMMGFIDYKIGLYEDEEAEYEREQKYEVPVVG